MAISCAANPATVRVWKSVSESTQTAVTVIAARRWMKNGRRQGCGQGEQAEREADLQASPGARGRALSPRRARAGSARSPRCWMPRRGRHATSRLGPSRTRISCEAHGAIVAAARAAGVPAAGDTDVTRASDVSRLMSRLRGGRRSLPGATTATRRGPSVSGMEATIEVNGLRKRFGQTVALDGLSFTVTPGT